MYELEDQPWFPRLLREFQTGYIGYLTARWAGYSRLLPLLHDPQCTAREQVDLCSGSGEPAITVFGGVARFTHLILTDLYPQHGVIQDAHITYDQRPMDARSFEPRSGTCYTMFNALHHFDDRDKVRLVHKLRAAGAEALLVEVLEPTVLCLCKVVLASTLGVLVFTPFVRPFSLARLLLTYVIPINIITITWDGLVSVLRSRSKSRYRALFAADPQGITVHHLQSRWRSIIAIQLLPS